jgi:hypothetical protein
MKFWMICRYCRTVVVMFNLYMEVKYEWCDSDKNGIQAYELMVLNILRYLELYQRWNIFGFKNRVEVIRQDWNGHIRSIKGEKLCKLTYLLTYLLTYSLTPWCRILFEKLVVTHLVKNILLSYGTRRFITVFTQARHWTLSWASWIQFAPSIPISLRSMLMLPSHLRLGLPSGLLPSGLPTKTL